MLNRLEGLEPDVDLTAVFDIHPPPGTYRAGPVELTGLPLPHFVPNVGIRVRAGEIAWPIPGTPARTRCWPNSAGTPTCSSSRPRRDGETQRPARNLMTSAEAGHWARQAGARRLMLTHFWPGNDRTDSVAAASAEFGGDVLAAEEDLVVRLG